jgi:hypothetical protein
MIDSLKSERDRDIEKDQANLICLGRHLIQSRFLTQEEMGFIKIVDAVDQVE